MVASIPSMNSNPDQVAPLIAVMEETRTFLARPDNDFAWSSWKDATTALREIDGLISRLKQGVLPPRLALTVLFLVTGPIQEVSVSSGWGKQFLALAKRFDSAITRVYGRDPREIAANKAEISDQINQLLGGRLRWFFSFLSGLATGFGIYLYCTNDTTEVYFPIHLKGDSVLYAMVLSSVVFGTLAIVNWVKWKRHQSLLAQNIFPPPACND